MRTDVKLGVVVALGLVLLSGIYYMRRDRSDQPVDMSDASMTDAAKTASEKANTAKKGAPRAASRDSKQGARKSASRRVDARPSSTKRPVKGSPGARQANNGGKRVTAPAGQHAKNNKRSSKAPSKAGSSKTASRNTVAKKQATSPVVPPASSGGARGTPQAAQARQASQARGTKGSPGSTELATNDRAPGKSRASNTGKSLQAQRQPAGKSTVDGKKATRSPNKAVARGDSAERVRRGSAATETHKVLGGQSFASLAKMYYGHEKYTQVLIDANPQIADPNRLSVGMTVKIPDLKLEKVPGTVVADRSSSRSSRAPVSLGGAGSSSGRNYTVRSGDTFYGIAKRELGDANRWRELLELNKAVVSGDPTRLRPGQVIILPKS